MRLIPSPHEIASLLRSAPELTTPAPDMGGTHSYSTDSLPYDSAGVLPTQPRAEQIERYHTWLSRQALKRDSIQHAYAMHTYKEAASVPVILRDQAFSTFAPLPRNLSAGETVTTWQIVAMAVLYALLLAAAFIFGSATLVALIAVVTVFYLSDLLVHLVLSMRTLHNSPATRINKETIAALAKADWPSYTVLCPLHKEANIVPQFVAAMEAIDYPREKLQVLLLVEDYDKETQDALYAQNLPDEFEVVVVPDGKPRTKPRACNYGLLHATGEYVVIYDAEDVPDPLQLKRAVLTFANMDERVACVQAKLNFYNPQQNLLTRWFAAEYSLWFDLTLPGLQKAGFVLPLGGTSNHFKVEVLREVAAWDPFNVTEDCDLGLRLAHHGYKTAVVDSTTYEEATSQVKNWIRQRSRWIKGYMQTYLVYMRDPMVYADPRRWREFVSLQMIVGGKTAVLLINPIMWALVLVYLLFRPYVADTYRTLFPAPVFYMGVFCLIMGNFFYIYEHLFGAFQRRHFSLVKWILLIPFYWVLTSVASFMALYELIVKPHHWQKTKHGMHLRIPGARLGFWRRDKAKATEAEKVEVAPITYEYAVQLAGEEEEPPVVAKPPFDWWRVASFVSAVAASIIATTYFFANDLQLVYGDAYAHMLIARRVVDNATPGLAQLGGIWLPLPHILIAPLSWNDWLWRTGLAGAIPSMVCYLLASSFVYLLIRRLTHSSPIAFVGSLVFILNPNVLYLQVTPLSETVLMAAMAMACYYFLAWVQEKSPVYLVLTGAATLLATLARYDGWVLFAAICVAIVIIGLSQRQKWGRIEAHSFMFVTFGGLGIALWFLWCAVIFGDPLYFQRSKYSSQTMQAIQLKYHLLYTYHNVWQSTRYFTTDTLLNVGPLILVLACLGVVAFLVRVRRNWSEALAALLCLVPFPFYIMTLWSGQAAMYLPQVVPAGAKFTLYNARYGSQMVAGAAVFAALLIAGLFTWLKVSWARVAILVAFGGLIVAQSAMTATSGIVSLEDGQYGLDCAPYHAIVPFMAQHYNGGRILQDLYISKIDSLESTADIQFKNIIYEGSGQYWTNAVNDPADTVQWIIVNPLDNRDAVAQKINLNDPAFTQKFELMLTEPMGMRLYHRIGGVPLAERAASRAVSTEHELCGAFGGGYWHDPYQTTTASAPTNTDSSSSTAESGLDFLPHGRLFTAFLPQTVTTKTAKKTTHKTTTSTRTTSTNTVSSVQK